MAASFRDRLVVGIFAVAATMLVGCAQPTDTAAPGAPPTAGLPASAAPGDTKDDEAANQAAYAKLGKKLPKLSFEDIEFQAAIQSLRDVTGADIRVKWNVLQQAGVEKTVPVNVQLTDVTFERAIRTILDDVSGGQALAFVVEDGVITISTQDDFSRRTITTVTRVYDIQDLIARFPDFAEPRSPSPEQIAYMSGPFANGHHPTSGPPEPEDTSPASKEEAIIRIIELVKSTIDQPSWRPTGELADIRDFGGQLVVTQTRENHVLLERLLWSLEPEWAHELRAKLRRPIDRVKLDKAKFQDAIRFVREASKANIVTDPAIQEGSLPPITIQGEKLTAEQVLGLISQVTRLRWQYLDGAVYVSPEVSPPAPARMPASSPAGGG